MELNGPYALAHLYCMKLCADELPSTCSCSRRPGNVATQITAKKALASVPPIKGTHRSPTAADSADGSDSDDSETLLPWARPSSSGTSDDSADGKARSAPEANSGRLNGANGRSQANQRDDGSSSRGSKSTGSHMPNSPSQDSTLSSSTDESEDEPNGNRRDHTLSIYDVYGRDSVAFPNFNLRHLSKGFNSESMASLALESANHPTPGIPDSFKESPRDPRAMPAKELAAKLKTSPSGRRPSAAPDPRAPPNQGVQPMASNLRQQVEAAVPPPPAPAPGPNQAPAPVGNFDPRRRPVGPPMPNGVPPPTQLRMPSGSSAPGSMSPSPTSPMAPQGIPRPGQPMPQGFGPGSNMPPPPMMSPGGSSPGSVPTPTGSHFPPGVQNSVFKPVRSSSDRSSERERISSGQLRKNPSNPSPGSFGGGPPSLRGSGISALSPPPTTSGSRSPSPLAASSSPGAPPVGLPSPVIPSRTASPAPSNMSGRRPPGAPGAPGPAGPVAYDAKGFVVGSGPPCRPDPNDREKLDKWHAILAENDLVAARKSRKVRKMVQAGIPDAVRGKVWLFLANAGVRRRAGLFEQLCKTSQEPKGKRGKEVLYEAIEKDVSRTYPDNKLFQDGSPGKADLEAILKAYVHYNPIIGYTQGMGLLVGMFLLHMPPEDAFWLLCALLRDIHMEGYYSNEMKQMHIDGVIFGQLLQSMDGPLANKLQGLGVEPIHFTPSWLLPLFARVVPWPTLLRLWDVFFYEGPNWILQVALAVVRIIREPLMAAHGPTAKEDCMMLLLHPPSRELTPENVVTCALSVKLKDGEMRKLSRNASKLVRDSTGARGRAPAGAKSDGVARSTSVPARR